MRASPEVNASGERPFRRCLVAAGLAREPVLAAADCPGRHQAVSGSPGGPRRDLLRAGGDPATGVQQPPTSRFDSLTGAFGVLYVGQHFDGAFAEAVLRNPRLRFVSRNYVTLRAVSEVVASRDLKLVDFHGPGLSAVGLTTAISTGPYDPCWAWSDYLWSHRDRSDGIAYASRHDPQQICYAVFERADVTFQAAPPTAFSSSLPEIKGLLRKYGKILTRS